MEIQKLQPGMRVKWEDPGLIAYDLEDREWVINRIFIVEEVLDEEEDPKVFLVEENGPAVAFARQHECIAI